MTARDEDRISYLAGDDAESLSADDRAQLDELRDALRAPATWVEPDPALEDRIVAAIAQEAAARQAAPAAEAGPAAEGAPAAEAGPAAEGAPAAEESPAAEGAPAAEAQPGPATVRQPSPRKRLQWGSLLRRPAFAFGAMASVAAAAIVAVVIANSSSSKQPLHFAMVVSGTALAPGARGNAHLTKTTSGWRIELAVNGLPHIENGRYYQAWLKNSAGILVPVGTFNDGKKVTLWSGVPVTKFRTLTVTVQLANGNPNSSGKRVLLGRIVPAG